MIRNKTVVHVEKGVTVCKMLLMLDSVRGPKPVCLQQSDGALGP